MAKQEFSWEKVDPVLARETLAAIAYKLKHDQPLTASERDYLADALEKIACHNVPAEKALRLTRRMGSQRKMWSEENIRIYNKVVELIDAGHSAREAFKIVASDPLAARKGRDESLSDKAIEAIYRELKNIISRD